MILYGIWVNSAIKSEGNAEELADSFYYLGFMLTLTALISSIPNFSGQSSHSRAENIAQMFGLGLTTTVIGLGGKLLFSQFKEFGPRSIEEAQAVLTRNISALAVQVFEASRYIQSSREQAATEVKNMAHTITQNFTYAVEQITTTVNTSASTLLTTATRLVEEHELRMSQNQASLSAIVSQLKQETDLLKDILKKIGSNTKKQSELLEKAGKESASAMEHFGQAAKSGMRFADQLGEVETKIAGVGQQCTVLSGQMQVLSEQLNSLKLSTDTLVNHVRQDLANVETYKNDIKRKVQEAQELIDQVHQSLLNASDFIMKKLSPTN